jgi:hypothetical protein
MEWTPWRDEGIIGLDTEGDDRESAEIAAILDDTGDMACITPTWLCGLTATSEFRDTNKWSQRCCLLHGF